MLKSHHKLQDGSTPENEEQWMYMYVSTVLLKGKLTVSTWNSILDPQNFRESRIKFRGLSFEDRESNFSRISNRDFEETI